MTPEHRTPAEPSLWKGSPWRRELRTLVNLAVPVVLSELGWMAQGVVDSIMVGRLGPASIGAVALGNAIFYTPSLFGIGLLLGLDTLVSHAYGRKDYDECHRWLAQGIYLASFITPILMTLIFAAGFGFALFGITPEVADPAAAYLRVLNWSVLPLLIYGAARRYLQGVGQVRVITLTYIAANLINWAGNWLLIYGHLGLPAMGVRGSALSTVVARILMAVFLMAFAWAHERRRKHALFHHWPRPQLTRMRELIRLGLPAATQMILEVGAWNAATLSAGWLSPVALATHQIAINYASVSYMIPLGVSAATAVSVGHALGAADLNRARRAGWLALGLGTAAMILAGLVFFIIPRPLIELYTHDPQILAVGPSLLWIAAAFQICDGIQTISTGALRGLGETRTPMFANLLGYWIIGLPLGLVLCFAMKWGIYGMWIGLTLALTIISAILLYRWHKDSQHLGAKVSAGQLLHSKPGH